MSVMTHMKFLQHCCLNMTYIMLSMLIWKREAQETSSLNKELQTRNVESNETSLLQEKKKKKDHTYWFSEWHLLHLD